MIGLLIALLIIFWLLGLLGHIGGGFVHVLLVIALIVLICRLLGVA